jgi:hypothetical protein
MTHIASMKRRGVLRIEKYTGKTNDDNPLQAYRCPFCSAWHVGHRPGKPKPRQA